MGIMTSKFTKLNKLKDQVSQTLAFEKGDVSLDIEHYKERVKSLTFNVEYHTKKVVEARLELQHIMNIIEDEMVNDLTPVNEPINILGADEMEDVDMSKPIHTPAYPKNK